MTPEDLVAKLDARFRRVERWVDRKEREERARRRPGESEFKQMIRESTEYRLVQKWFRWLGWR